MGGQTHKETERRTEWVTELTRIDWPYWWTDWPSNWPLEQVNDCLTDGVKRRGGDGRTDYLTDPIDGLIGHLTGHLSKWMIAWLMGRRDAGETDGRTTWLTLLMNWSTIWLARSPSDWLKTKSTAADNWLTNKKNCHITIWKKLRRKNGKWLNIKPWLKLFNLKTRHTATTQFTNRIKRANLLQWLGQTWYPVL